MAPPSASKARRAPTASFSPGRDGVTRLRERVDVTIRDVPFAHERYADLGSRPYTDCVPDAADKDDDGGDGDGKADEVGASDTSDPAAGCAAAGSSTTLAGLPLALFAMLIATRRRRR
jgi:MYXO-CTERM domain-containing protein